MTIELRKTALISWITKLEDEAVINQIEGYRSAYLSDLPKEIIELLNISDSSKEEDCIEHTNSRTLLGR